jgi:hypothetical protein
MVWPQHIELVRPMPQGRPMILPINDGLRGPLTRDRSEKRETPRLPHRDVMVSKCAKRIGNGHGKSPGTESGDISTPR